MISTDDGRDPDVLTAEELGRKIGLEVRAIRGLYEQGRIPGIRVGRGLRFSYSAVLSVLRPHGLPTTEGISAPVVADTGRDPDVVTAQELGRELGLPPITVQRLWRRGAIPGMKVGKNLRFSRSAVLAKLAHQTPTAKSTQPPPMLDDDGRDADVLTAEELASRLGLHVETVRWLWHRGELPGMKVGTELRFSYTAVVEGLRSPHPDATAARTPTPEVWDQARRGLLAYLARR